jgi:hypothetical protein
VLAPDVVTKGTQEVGDGLLGGGQVDARIVTDNMQRRVVFVGPGLVGVVLIGMSLAGVVVGAGLVGTNLIGTGGACRHRTIPQ